MSDGFHQIENHIFFNFCCNHCVLQQKLRRTPPSYNLHHFSILFGITIYGLLFLHKINEKVGNCLSVGPPTACSTDNGIFFIGAKTTPIKKTPSILICLY